MIVQVVYSIGRKVKYWWVSLVVGILSLMLGMSCVLTPDKTLVALTYIFIFAFLIGGVIDIIFAVANRKLFPGWGWSLTSGILEILLGIALLFLPTPLITAILVYLVGFWILFRSIWMVGEACQMQMLRIRGWGWLLTIAIISIILSIVYLVSPLFAGITVIVLAACALIGYGIFRIAFAFQLRADYKKMQEEFEGKEFVYEDEDLKITTKKNK